MAKLAQLPRLGRSAEVDADLRHVPRLRTRYYAFLSYSHKDKELADWLHRELERFRVPHSLAGKLTANGVVPRRLSPVFRDQQDLSAGGDLAQEIKAVVRSGNKRKAKALAAKLVDLALAGNVRAAQIVLDRVDGRVRTAEEIARIDSGSEPQMTAEERRHQLIEVLKQPEMKALILEAIKPETEQVN